CARENLHCSDSGCSSHYYGLSSW
nr:immunoglobulin heavy chain junction region [Macaca mulatta]